MENLSALVLLLVGHSILLNRMVARIQKMVSLLKNFIEVDYGTLHVRHFGVEKENRLHRGNANVEEVIYAAAVSLKGISSIVEGYADKLDFASHCAL